MADTERAPAPIDPSSSSGDEWEYEYDHDEVHKVYVVLDLPQSSSVYQPRYERHPSRPPRRTVGSLMRARPVASPPDATGTGGINQDGFTLARNERPREAETQQAEDNLQVLDITSKRPIVKYQGSFYQCRWSDFIGTEMLFSSRSQKVRHLPTLLQGSRFCLHPFSSIKLQGHPINVVERRPNSTLTAKFAPHSMKQRAVQHEFLSKLRDVKRRKGQTDRVPMVVAQSWGGVRGQAKYQFKGRGELPVEGAAAAGDQDHPPQEDNVDVAAPTIASLTAVAEDFVNLDRRRLAPLIPPTRSTLSVSYMPDDRPATAQLWPQRSGGPQKRARPADEDGWGRPGRETGKGCQEPLSPSHVDLSHE